jgi:isocitrate/isopropylmalate dehydrogenase
MFEAVHGSAPDIAGRGIANPTALILAAAMLCEHVGQADVARRIQGAAERVLGERRVLTRDLGGTAGTREFTDAVVAALAP